MKTKIKILMYADKYTAEQAERITQAFLIHAFVPVWHYTKGHKPQWIGSALCEEWEPTDQLPYEYLPDCGCWLGCYTAATITERALEVKP